MATRRKRKKSKPAVGLVIVVNTDNDEALDIVVEAAEGLVEELESEVDLTVTFAANLPAAEDEPDDEDEVDDDDDLDDEEEEEDDEESEDTDDAPVIDEEYLESLSLSELKELAEEHDIEVKKGKRSSTYIKELLEVIESDEEEPEDDEESEDVDDEESEDEEYLTLADLKKMKTPKLKELAKEYGIKVRTSWGKSDIIDAIVEVAAEE